jgi:hypothetical protein
MANTKSKKRATKADRGDVITQRELRAFFRLDEVIACMATGIYRRVKAGATVQRGPLTLDTEHIGDHDQTENGASNVVSGRIEVNMPSTIRGVVTDRDVPELRAWSRKRERAAKQGAVRRTEKAGARQ